MKKKFKNYRDWIDYDNELLQLHYSLENLQTLREFKENHNEVYQADLNDEDLQNNLRKWRDLKNTPEEENKREFEEIKKMVLYFRDRSLFFLDWLELSEEKIQKERDSMDYDNELLQLDYSLKNLSRLKWYKERNEKVYRANLNDEELQNNLRKWRDLKNTPEEENKREFEEIKKMVLYFRDRSLFFLDWLELSEEKIQKERDSMDYDNELLQLDYSLKNLSRLKWYKERNEKVYRANLNDEELQNNLREWRRSKRR